MTDPQRMADEKGEYRSGCTEPEFTEWWDRFGPALDADSRMTRESMAFAGFCAGLGRGRKDIRDLRALLIAQAAQLEQITDERKAAKLRAYRKARVFEPSMDGYSGAMAVYEAAFPDEPLTDVERIHILNLEATELERAQQENRELQARVATLEAGAATEQACRPGENAPDYANSSALTILPPPDGEP